MPVPAGLSAVIEVSLTTVKFVAGIVPKSTAVAPVKPVPVIVTKVPPASGPAVGADARDRRHGRVGELIGRGRGRRPARRRHGHVHGAGARRAVGRDRRVTDDGEARRRRRAEVDRRGAGEAGPGDRHQRAAGRADRPSGSCPRPSGA